MLEKYSLDMIYSRSLEWMVNELNSLVKWCNEKQTTIEDQIKTIKSLEERLKTKIDKFSKCKLSNCVGAIDRYSKGLLETIENIQNELYQTEALNDSYKKTIKEQEAIIETLYSEAIKAKTLNYCCYGTLIEEKDKEIKSLKNGMATLQKKLEGVINVRNLLFR
jgi:Zn-dependent oligopeptidase